MRGGGVTPDAMKPRLHYFTLDRLLRIMVLLSDVVEELPLTKLNDCCSEASTELRCQKLLNQIITVTTTKSKEWTHQDMSQMETFEGAEALTPMKKGN